MALVVSTPTRGMTGVAEALTLFSNRLHGIASHEAADPTARLSEVSEIAVLNQRALAAMGDDPWDIGEFRQTWFANADAIEIGRELGDMVAREVQANDLLLVDDPALCRLLPLWNRLCAERGLSVHFFIPVHHPMDVAIELEEIHGLPIVRGLLVWLRYFVEQERGTYGFPRSFITVGPAAKINSGSAMSPVGGIPSGKLPRLVAQAYRWGISAARNSELSDEPMDVAHDTLRWVHLAYMSDGVAPSVAGEAGKSAQETIRQLEQERNRLIVAVSELSGMAAAVQDLNLERQLLSNRLRLAENDSRIVLSSSSWRLTAPLRSSRSKLSSMARLARSGHPLALWRRRLLRSTGFFPSAGCTRALQALVNLRCRFSAAALADPLLAAPPSEWPMLDLSIVTHNSRSWLDAFFGSLLGQSYPLERIHVHVVDNASTDDTYSVLESVGQLHGSRFAHFELLRRPNHGFGAGHNAAIAAGNSAFVLVTNVDITFEPDSLTRIVSIALADTADVGCWELRQRPFEHPKYYDPVTGLTNWNAYACVLLRRSAFKQVGGFDERIFMYGEDVDLSYRLRDAGFALRYCPPATVNHYAYAHYNEVKPSQFRGTTFANLFLRLRFGSWRDVAVIPYLAASVMLQPSIYPGSRRDSVHAVLRALRHLPLLLRSRRRHRADFPFLGWDYDFARYGSFARSEPTAIPAPLVSVITRTHGTRGVFLAQALFSVAHQVYPNVEHIVVEDGGDGMRAVIDHVVALTGKPVRHIPLPKVGRSAAGNAGLAAATGKYIVFLDDDDLFFHDHLEMLVNALSADPDAAAAYTLAWEVRTDTADLAQRNYTEERIELSALFMQEFDFDVLCHHNYLPIQAVLFKRDLFFERGGFDTELEALEDWNLWLRYAFNHRFVYVPKVTSLFRTPADSTVRTQRARALDAAYAPVRDRTRALIRSMAIGGRAPERLLPATTAPSPRANGIREAEPVEAEISRHALP